MGTLIAVGQKYPLFQKGTKEMMYQDGALMEAMDDGGGFILAVYLNQPHPEEIEIVRHKPINVKVLRQENFILSMVQFGDTQMIFEISFDPTLYEDTRAFQMKGINNLLTIVLIDSSTGRVAALRQANLPLKFIQECAEAWAKAFLEPNYSNNYKNWYIRLQQHPIISLWNRAHHVGKLGESYNLEEVNYSPKSQHYK